MILNAVRVPFVKISFLTVRIFKTNKFRELESTYFLIMTIYDLKKIE